MPKTSPLTAATENKLTTHIETLRSRLGGPFHSLPRKSTVSQLMQHGGFQILTATGAVIMRLKKYMPEHADADLAWAATQIKTKAAMFFQRLCGKRYGIPAELISYLTFPHEGTTYTDPDRAGGGESKYSGGVYVCWAVRRSRSYVQWGESF